MIKTMTARYPGRCARTGAPIRPGDQIKYDTQTRRAWVTEPGDFDSDDSRAPRFYDGKYVSHVFNIGGNEYYRNKKGRCEDAPCCGCCTI